MSTRQVDLLNVGLMLGSCALAFALPFDLFLISYAVLGPLHYLTEIAWLHQREYFVPRRREVVWLVLPLVLLLLALWGESHWGPGRLDIARIAPLLNAAGLGTALALVVTRNTRVRLGIVAAAVLVGWTWVDTRGVHDLLRLLLPTMIHVWLFTGAFVLYGALRGRSVTGLAALLVFLACSVACFAIQPTGGTLQVRPAYNSIVSLNVTLYDWISGASPRGPAEALFSPLGRGIARFIAFAYTYHYLNWFSKTSIIQWHRIPRAWAITNVVLWLASVGLYAYDYMLGLTVLFALSYLHVYLELPLNHRTFAGIGRELTALARGRAAGSATGRPAGRATAR